MIRFRYAIAKRGGGSAAESVNTSAAVFAQQKGVRNTEDPVVYESFDELPVNLRPKLMTESEMETVLMGGVAPYVPKHLQRKKK